LIQSALACGGELGRLHGPAYAATKRLLWGGELERIQAGLEDEVARFIDLFEARFSAAAR
jgi:hypothetical protein